MTEAEVPSAGRRAARGATYLAIRQVAVAVVTYGGLLALSALLDPSDFAMYGYVNIVFLISASVGDLGLGAALIRGSAEDDVVRGSVALQLAVWVPICVIGAALAAAFGAYSFEVLTAVTLFAAFLVLAMQTIPTALLERRMSFGTVATIETLQRTVFFLAAVALAALAPKQWSIPVAALGAALLSLPAVLYAVRWRWAPRFHRDEPLFRGFSSDWWQSRIANQLAYAAYPLLGGILFSQHDVGLIVWALAFSSVPALLAPTVARAVFPAIARLDDDHQIGVYSRLFNGLMLIGMPMAAALLACADPLTQFVFGGEKWVEAIPLLRLESITTALGLILTPMVPLLFLALPSHQVKRYMVAATIGVWIGGVALAGVSGFRSISIATIIVNSTLILIFEVLLRRSRGYSPLRDSVPSVAGAALATAGGLLLAPSADSAIAALGLAAGVGIAAAGLTAAFGGGVDVRIILRRAGPGTT